MKTKKSTTFIYGLYDPRSNELRYVGKSDNPRVRLARHLDDSRHESSAKAKWIQELRALKLKPRLEIIAEVPRSEWKQKERQTIKECRDQGIPLLNIHKGGGGSMEWEDERRAIYHDRMIRLWQDPEFRDRMTAAIREAQASPEFQEGRKNITLQCWQDPSYRELVIEKMTQAWDDEERRKKCSERTKQLYSNQEFKEEWYQAVVAAWNDDGRRQALSERNHSLWDDPAQREKWINGIRCGQQSPDYREYQSKRMKSRWDDPSEREKLTAARRATGHSLEERQETSERNKRLWNDPEHRRKRCEAMRHARRTKRAQKNGLESSE